MTRLLKVSGRARFLKIKDMWWTDGSLAPFKTAPLMFKDQQISISKAIRRLMKSCQSLLGCFC